MPTASTPDTTNTPTTSTHIDSPQIHRIALDPVAGDWCATLSPVRNESRSKQQQLTALAREIKRSIESSMAASSNQTILVELFGSVASGLNGVGSELDFTICSPVSDADELKGRFIAFAHNTSLFDR